MIPALLRLRAVLPRVAPRLGPLPATLPIVTLEGCLATVFTVCTGGAFLTGMALACGADDFELGLLAAVPLLTPVAQLGSAFLIDRTGARKKVTVLGCLAARQVWWLVVLALVVPFGHRLELLLAVVVACSVAGNVSSIGWVSWMADLVPEETRGRYFGTRNVVLSIASLVTTMGGGAIIDHYRGEGALGSGFAVILSITGLASLASAALLERTPDRVYGDSRLGWEQVLEPLRSRSFRHLLGVFVVWNVAIGISAAFFTPHMLTNLGMSFTMVALYNGAAAIIAMIMNRPWGFLIDRFGCRPVIVSTAFGISLVPLIWLVPTRDSLWVLMPEVLFSNICWTGFNLAAFNLPIAASPARSRTIYLALFATVSGLAFFAASVLGGVLAESWAATRWEIGGRVFVNYHLLFLFSAGLRAAAGLVALTFLEPQEQRLPVMFQFLGHLMLRGHRGRCR